jgi:hypothetical protein
MNPTVKAPDERPEAQGRRPRQVVDEAFALVRQELLPFVDRHMRSNHIAGENWHSIATRFWLGAKTRDDAGNLLRVMDENWTCFGDVLDPETRIEVRALRAARKDFVHTRPFTVAQAVQSVKTAASLLRAIGAHCESAVSELLVALSLADAGRDLSRIAAQVGGPARTHHVTRVRQDICNEALRAGWIDRVTSHFGTRYQQAGTVHLETGRVDLQLRSVS